MLSTPISIHISVLFNTVERTIYTIVNTCTIKQRSTPSLHSVDVYTKISTHVVYHVYCT